MIFRPDKPGNHTARLQTMNGTGWRDHKNSRPPEWSEGNRCLQLRQSRSRGKKGAFQNSLIGGYIGRKAWEIRCRSWRIQYCRLKFRPSSSEVKRTSTAKGSQCTRGPVSALAVEPLKVDVPCLTGCQMKPVFRWSETFSFDMHRLRENVGFYPQCP